MLPLSNALLLCSNLRKNTLAIVKFSQRLRSHLSITYGMLYLNQMYYTGNSVTRRGSPPQASHFSSRILTKNQSTTHQLFLSSPECNLPRSSLHFLRWTFPQIQKLPSTLYRIAFLVKLWLMYNQILGGK